MCECLSKGNKRNKISKLKYIKTKYKAKKLNQKQEKEKKSQLRKEKMKLCETWNKYKAKEVI